MPLSKPTAFDAFAGDYDSDFTHSILGRLLRPRVWEIFGEYFKADSHILELACGTGEDAVWLARQGVFVTATDGASEMVNVARAKAKAAAVSERVTTAQISLQQISDGFFSRNDDDPLTSAELSSPRPTTDGPSFDGVFSNFGGLNTIYDWKALARSLAKVVRPEGNLVLVPMGPFCPWEVVWYLGHGQPNTGFRRFGRRATAKIGPETIPIWYPSARRLRADFGPWFRHLHTESLGLWLPPSYLDHVATRWPGLISKLNRFEQSTSHLTRGWGDHYIITFERQKTPL